MWKAIGLALLLSGCSVIQTAAYDPGEYWLVSSIRAQARTNDCSDTAKDKLHELVTHLVLHSQGLPHNSQQVKLDQELQTVIDSLWSAPNSSLYYCTAVLKTIDRMAERLQLVTGSKPR